MGAQGLGMSLEAGIVAGNVAGGAAVYVRSAELGHDDLFDPGRTFVEGVPLGVGLGQAAGLREIGGLVLLPAVEELIVEDDAVHDQHHKTDDGEGYARTHEVFLTFLLASLVTTARRTPSSAPGRMCR